MPEPRAPLTPEHFRDRMLRLRQDMGGDPEGFRSLADDLMAETLRCLGYGEGIDIFRQAEKWRA